MSSCVVRAAFSYARFARCAIRFLFRSCIVARSPFTGRFYPRRVCTRRVWRRRRAKDYKLAFQKDDSCAYACTRARLLYRARRTGFARKLILNPSLQLFYANRVRHAPATHNSAWLAPDTRILCHAWRISLRSSVLVRRLPRVVAQFAFACTKIRARAAVRDQRLQAAAGSRGCFCARAFLPAKDRRLWDTEKRRKNRSLGYIDSLVRETAITYRREATVILFILPTRDSSATHSLNFSLLRISLFNMYLFIPISLTVSYFDEFISPNDCVTKLSTNTCCEYKYTPYKRIAKFIAIIASYIYFYLTYL